LLHLRPYSFDGSITITVAHSKPPLEGRKIVSLLRVSPNNTNGRAEHASRLLRRCGLQRGRGRSGNSRCSGPRAEVAQYFSPHHTPSSATPSCLSPNALCASLDARTTCGRGAPFRARAAKPDFGEPCNAVNVK